MNILFFRNNNSNTRSSIVRSNILAMMFVKGGTIITNLLLVPIVLNYVDNATYGIWLTLSSVIAWMSFFDVGLNNGLKNKLTESLALGDLELSKKYVSTTYAIISCIFLPLMIVLLLLSFLLDWNSIFNITTVPGATLTTAIQIIVVYFCLNFILSTINVVLQADQKPAEASLRTFLQHLLSLLIIYGLSLFTKGNLVNLTIGLCVMPIVVVAIFNFTLYTGRYKAICPSFKYVDFSLAPSLMKLGVQFFIIQISAIIQFQLANFIIIRNFGAEDVTAYNLAYKYFSTLYMLWGIFLAPLWPAVTDALTKNEVDWVKKTLKKYIKIFMLFLVGAIVMLLVSNIAYRIWVGDKVEVSFSLSFMVMLFFVSLMFGGPFVAILNGAGQLKLQSIAGIIAPIIYLGVVHILIKSGVGVHAVLIAMIVSNVYGYCISPIQCYKFLNSKQV